MQPSLSPLPGFTALPGCHCVTGSFRKICAYNHYPISEEMLLGLGAGVGFIYWHAKGQPPFLGGRGNAVHFTRDLSQRTGIAITEHTSASPRAAERALLDLLDSGQPAAVHVDMPYMPYLGLPPEAHFGGHAVVVCAYDPAARQALIADLAPRETGVKAGILNPVSLDQLALARASKFPPFAPHNLWYTFDFSQARPPRAADVSAAIAQAAQAMLHPPIQNMGVPGIRTAAKRVAGWGKTMEDAALRQALFNVYVFVEIGGTGGGLFRAMYARFLEEAAALTGLDRLANAAGNAAGAFHACAARWSALAAACEKAYELPNPAALLPALQEGLLELYEMERKAWEMIK